MEGHSLAAEEEAYPRQSQVLTSKEPQEANGQQRQHCTIAATGASPFLAAQAALSQLTLPRQPGFKPAWLLHAAMRRYTHSTLAKPMPLPHSPPQHSGPAAVLCSHASIQPAQENHYHKATVVHGTRTTVRPTSAASSHHMADPILHCHSAGILHVPMVLQTSKPGSMPSQALSALTGAPFILQPAASMAGAAAASIVTSVVTAAMQAARQDKGASPGITPQLSKVLPACLLSESGATPCQQQQQQQEHPNQVSYSKHADLLQVPLAAAGMAVSAAAAAVTVAKAAAKAPLAMDPLCTGAMAIGASAAALAAGMAFLPQASQPAPTVAGVDAQAFAPVVDAANASGLEVQPEPPSGKTQEQDSSTAAQPTPDGLSLCTFCGGERPCHAPCPLAVATAALQGLHLQGIYNTGRFRVACFVGDKPSSCVASPCPSQQASPRGSPTCSPTASSHSLCSALAPSSVVSSPSKAGACNGLSQVSLPASSIAALTPPTSQGSYHGQDATAVVTLSCSSSAKQQQSIPQPASLQPPGAQHAVSSSHGPHRHDHEQRSSQVQAGQQLMSSCRVVTRPQGLSRPSKTQRKGRFMVVEYNDLVDAAKAAAMAAMVSAGDQDGGEAAAKAAALHVVRDAAQPVACLGSSTSALTLADRSCIAQQAPDPYALASSPSRVPSAIFTLASPCDAAAAAAPVDAQPAAAAAAAVAAAALLDHAANSIAHAAISAATQGSQGPLAFDSPDNQAHAAAVMGWQPHAVTATGLEPQASGSHIMPPTPFLIHHPCASYDTYGSAPVPFPSALGQEVVARAGMWLSDSGACPMATAAAAPAAQAAPATGSSQNSPITPAGDRLAAPGSHIDAKQGAAASPSAAPPAPRAYRKGRFSIQEVSKESLPPSAATTPKGDATPPPLQVAGLNSPPPVVVTPPTVVCPPQPDAGCQVVSPGLVPLPAPGSSTVYATTVPTAGGMELHSNGSNVSVDRTTSSQLPPLSHTISEGSSMGDVGEPSNTGVLRSGSPAKSAVGDKTVTSSDGLVEPAVAQGPPHNGHVQDHGQPAGSSTGPVTAPGHGCSLPLSHIDGNTSVTLTPSWRRNLTDEFGRPSNGSSPTIPCLAPAPTSSAPHTDVVCDHDNDGQQGRDQGVQPAASTLDRGSFQLVPMLPSQLHELRDASRSAGWPTGQLRDLLSSRSEHSLAMLRTASAASVDTGTGISFAEWAMQSKKLIRTEAPPSVLGDVDRMAVHNDMGGGGGDGVVGSFTLAASQTHQPKEHVPHVPQLPSAHGAQPPSRSWSWAESGAARATPAGGPLASSSSISIAGLAQPDAMRSQDQVTQSVRPVGVVPVAAGSRQLGLVRTDHVQYDQLSSGQSTPMSAASTAGITAAVGGRTTTVASAGGQAFPAAPQQTAAQLARESAPVPGASRARKVGRFTIIDS